MTKNEAIKILGILSAAYPSMSKQDDFSADALINLWAEAFMEDHAEKVVASVMMYVESNNKFAPAIGEVKENMRMMDRLLHNGKLSVREYMGDHSYFKLPMRTRQYIEKVESQRKHAELEEPKQKIGSFDNQWTKELFFEKMAQLYNDKDLNIKLGLKKERKIYE